jgi:hypothetical protein
MLGLPLAFSAPLLLTALVALPALWYLLRLTPPPPNLQPLPTTPLLRDLDAEERKPARTPWWLLLLRCAIAALIILAMAGPIFNPAPPVSGGRAGPVAVILDDGWTAAPDWAARTEFAERVLGDLGSRPVALRAVSEPATAFEPTTAAAAAERLRSLAPQPFTADRMAQVAAASGFLEGDPEAEAVWISDGVSGGPDRAAIAALSARAGDRLTVVAPSRTTQVGLAGVENSAESMTVRAVRVPDPAGAEGLVRALDQRGRPLGEARFAFAGGEGEAQARLDLPLELRNDVTCLEIADVLSAGAVRLVDDNQRRRRVGLVSGETADVAQPLISPAYFIRKALEPFAELRVAPPSATDPIVRLIEDGATMIVLADVGLISGETRRRLEAFVEGGGVLVRFAGVKLASADDDLVPVRLRRGGRTLGGALSWDEPKRLAPFPETGPFAGLSVPADVTVTRQVLAEPDGEIGRATWAALEDGTPLVTGVARGEGAIALFHVTADTSWSNLPLSGLFVEMLRRLVASADASATGGAAAAAPELVAPARTLDGEGRFRTPPATARPVDRNRVLPASLDHPAGFYGPPEALVAVNVLAADAALAPLDPPGAESRTVPLVTAEPIDLRAPLILLALLLFAVDAVAAMGLSGALGRLRPGRRAAAASLAGFLALGLSIAEPRPAAAQEGAAATPAATQPRPDRLPDIRNEDIEAALETRLAYIVTGDASIDEASRYGLDALSRYLAIKTALEPAEPVGLDPERDEMVFYPIVYWPMRAGAEAPSAEALARIDTYMKNGGTLIFDTRDAFAADLGDGSTTPETQALRTILGALDVPALEPIPRDHVVTKTFYLLDRFVGRYANGRTWIEAMPPEEAGADPENRPARAGDRVSPIIITSNDLAGAWAANEEGEPLFPVSGDDPRQRDLAFRAGVNLVIYALTGNYKADQVHVPALLERLGQ